ncbi:UDP-glucose dehydrogenase family protein [Chloroflexota bacterium]
MKIICIIGSGHVGLVTGVCLAELGNRVICIDNDVQKIADLKKGIIPYYEPGLEEMVHKYVNEGRLSFTTSIAEGVKASEIIFIAVGTPQKANGEVDLTYIEGVSREISKAIDSYRVIVEKSTVPAKTGAWIKRTILNNNSNIDFDVVSNPEFLREGSGIYDTLNPDRIVIGVESERAASIMTELYKPLNAPIIITNIETAELIKHASNSFLALKISYINAIANICEKLDADVVKVAEGMGYDKRIGRDFLNAGVGYGGYCFPKDLLGFIRLADEVDYNFELLKIVKKINDSQRRLVIKKLRNALWNLSGKTIGIWGLSFKPNTDDIREAPSLDIIEQLMEEGAKVKSYDPQAMGNVKKIFPDIEYCNNPYQVAEGSEALLIITEWDEFKDIDLPKVKRLLKQPIMIDGRNIYDPQVMKELGFIYQGIGRK